MCQFQPKRLAEHIFASQKLFADDTPIPVLDPGRGRTKTGRLWVYARDDRPWNGPDPPAAVYLYSPNRKAGHSKNFSEYLAPGELNSFDDLKPEAAGLSVKDFRSSLAYRDLSGKLLGRSAACTHLGCRLHWISFETCWDCPCHSSKFAVDGTALNAPAVDFLAK